MVQGSHLYHGHHGYYCWSSHTSPIHYDLLKTATCIMVTTAGPVALILYKYDLLKTATCLCILTKVPIHGWELQTGYMYTNRRLLTQRLHTPHSTVTKGRVKCNCQRQFLGIGWLNATTSSLVQEEAWSTDTNMSLVSCFKGNLPTSTDETCKDRLFAALW